MTFGIISNEIFLSVFLIKQEKHIIEDIARGESGAEYYAVLHRVGPTDRRQTGTSLGSPVPVLYAHDIHTVDAAVVIEIRH